MNAHEPARTFISYSTKDGAGTAAELRGLLTGRGFLVWREIERLEVLLGVLALPSR